MKVLSSTGLLNQSIPLTVVNGTAELISTINISNSLSRVIQIHSVFVNALFIPLATLAEYNIPVFYAGINPTLNSSGQNIFYFNPQVPIIEPITVTLQNINQLIFRARITGGTVLSETGLTPTAGDVVIFNYWLGYYEV